MNSLFPNQSNLNLSNNTFGMFGNKNNPNQPQYQVLPQNIQTNKDMDYLKSKLSVNKITKESQDEMYSKLVKDYNEFSKVNNIKNQLQLESLDLNLDCLDQMILPDYLKSKKSLFQLLALADNDKKEILKKNNDIYKAHTFLSDNGQNVSKMEKEINEIKNYLISSYDFSSDLNNINLQDKTNLNDHKKLYINSTTNSLWAKTNDNIIFSNNLSRKKKGIDYINKISNIQNSEFKKFNSLDLSSNKKSEDFSNTQNVNLPNFQMYNKNLTSNKFSNQIINPNKNYFQTDNKFQSEKNNLKNQNFTPLKTMNLNYNTFGNKQNFNQFSNVTGKKIISAENVPLNYNPRNFTSNIPNKKQYSTFEYIENLRMVNPSNSNNFSDENQINHFISYFENLKSYFYYKINNEVLLDDPALLISKSELNNFKAIPDDKKNNILPITLILNKLSFEFEKTRDISRQNIFNLLSSQINCFKKWSDTDFAVENVLNNSIRYYENLFLKRIISTSNDVYIKNKKESEIKDFDYRKKYLLVENYANNLLSKNFIRNFQERNARSDIERIKKWTIIYVFIRAGLIEECSNYLGELQEFNNRERINDTELILFSNLFIQIYSNLPIELSLYEQLSDGIKNKNLKDSDPFKFCCFNLLLKINQPLNENIFENFEDYIWYHLSIIQKNNNFLDLIEKIKIELKYLSLKEFQDFIKNKGLDNLNSTSDFYLDYAKCLFSILLFEDGINFLLKAKSYIIDSINIGFILKEINLLRNFTDEDLYINLYEFRYSQSKCLEINLNSFIDKISNKNLFEILLYVRYILEKEKEYLDLFCDKINSFGNYSLLLNENIFIEVQEKKIFFKNILSPEDKESLISSILKQAISNIDQKSDHMETLNDLIQLAKINKSYENLAQLVIRDSIDIIKYKLSKTINSSEKNFSALINQKLNNKNILNEKYKTILDEIKFDYSKLEPNFQFNIKILRQLENLEEVIDLLETKGISTALETFIKKVNIIPFKSEDVVQEFIKVHFLNLFDSFKQFIPEVMGILFYLLTNRIKEIKKQTFGSVNEELFKIDEYRKNLTSLFYSISNNVSLKNSESLKSLKEKIDDFQSIC